MNELRKIVLYALCAASTVFASLGFYSLCYFERANEIEISSRKGERGEETVLIQERLYELGFYGGEIDGIYDRETSEAVRKFQQKNGIYANGVAGEVTIAKLQIYENYPHTSTQDYGNSSLKDEHDIELLSRFIEYYGKDRTYLCKLAIGATVINRTKSSKYPSNVTGVIYRSGDYSDFYFASGPVTDESYRAALFCLKGLDPVCASTAFAPKKRFSHKENSSENIEIDNILFYID